MMSRLTMRCHTRYCPPIPGTSQPRPPPAQASPLGESVNLLLVGLEERPHALGHFLGKRLSQLCGRGGRKAYDIVRTSTPPSSLNPSVTGRSTPSANTHAFGVLGELLAALQRGLLGLSQGHALGIELPFETIKVQICGTGGGDIKSRLARALDPPVRAVSGSVTPCTPRNPCSPF